MDATDYLILDLVLKGLVAFVVVLLLAVWFFRGDI